VSSLDRSTLKIDAEVAVRLREFLASDLFQVRSKIAKTKYWEHHSGELQANVGVDSASVKGSSGYYIAPSASIVRRTVHNVARATRNPGKAAAWFLARVSPFVVPRLMTYESAFDAVMTHAPVSDPDLSPFLVNHLRLAQKPNVHANVASVKKHYESWSGHFASGNIICHYYYQNLLRGFVAADRVRTVLEIGPGNGNFPSILFHGWAPVRVIMIDLPEALAVSIPFLSSLFPKAQIAMPNEIELSGLPQEFDFAFLTVDQVGLMPDDTVDLAINCHSFQEMTHAQIKAYLELVQRVCRDSGWFFSANRVEKVPCGPDAFTVEQLDPPNRMAEYPWHAGNEVLVYQVSKLSRLVQLDAVAIRLERVRKSGRI
jgi:putative sugar O-methyltransferase